MLDLLISSKACSLPYLPPKASPNPYNACIEIPVISLMTLFYGKFPELKPHKSSKFSSQYSLRLSESNLVLKSRARKVSSSKTFLIRKRKVL